MASRRGGVPGVLEFAVWASQSPALAGQLQSL